MLTRETVRIIAVLALILTIAAAALGARVVVREKITITVDRNAVQTDVPPIMVQGRTLVPVRSIFDAFGATIDWIPCDQRVFIRRGNQVIWLRIGAAHADVDGHTMPLAVPAMIYRGRTMVPLRFVAEALGSTVSWDPDTQTITIYTDQTQPIPEAQPVPEAQPREATPS